MDNKKLGIAIIIIAILFSVVLFVFKGQLNDVIRLQMEASGGSCFTPEGECLHEQSDIPFLSGLAVVFLTLILGIFILFLRKSDQTVKPEDKPQILPEKITKDNYQDTLEKLDEDEKVIFEHIIDAKGTIFQSDLVEKSNFTKVKVTRVLDKLEGRALIERKRRGMTNVVILKHS